jgi:hypothetical protein
VKLHTNWDVLAMGLAIHALGRSYYPGEYGNQLVFGAVLYLLMQCLVIVFNIIDEIHARKPSEVAK